MMTILFILVLIALILIVSKKQTPAIVITLITIALAAFVLLHQTTAGREWL